MTSDIPQKGRPFRSYKGQIIALCAVLLCINAGVSYGISRLSRPVVVAFNMKGTVDLFFDQASQKTLPEEQAGALTARFNRAMEASLDNWQKQHNALILVSPAVVQGAADITPVIQKDIARRMAEGE